MKILEQKLMCLLELEKLVESKMNPRCIYAGMADNPGNTTGEGLRESAEMGNEVARRCLACGGTRAWAIKVGCDGRFYSRSEGIRVTGPDKSGRFRYTDIEEEKRMRELEEFAERSIAEIKKIQAEIDRDIAELEAA